MHASLHIVLMLTVYHIQTHLCCCSDLSYIFVDELGVPMSRNLEETFYKFYEWINEFRWWLGKSRYYQCQVYQK